MVENVYPEPTPEVALAPRDLTSALAEFQRAIAKSERAAEGDSNDAEFEAAADLREAGEHFLALAQSALAHHPRPADLGYLFRPALPVFLVMGTRVHASAFREAHGLRGADVVCALSTEASGDWFRKLEVRRVEVVEVETWRPMQAKDAELARASLARAAELNERNGWDEVNEPVGQLFGGFLQLTEQQQRMFVLGVEEQLSGVDLRRGLYGESLASDEAPRVASALVSTLNALLGGAS